MRFRKSTGVTSERRTCGVALCLSPNPDRRVLPLQGVEALRRSFGSDLGGREVVEELQFAVIAAGRFGHEIHGWGGAEVRNEGQCERSTGKERRLKSITQVTRYQLTDTVLYTRIVGPLTHLLSTRYCQR
jgi:hypothetical protein